MKPSDISFSPEVGQYWFLLGEKTPSRIVDISDNLVRFDDGNVSALPLHTDFRYLWYTNEIYISYFSTETPPKPGQMWVSDRSQDVFFIHPNQENTDNNFFRVLSDSSNIMNGKATLLREASSSDLDGVNKCD